MNCYLSIKLGITIIIYYLVHAAFESSIWSEIYYNVLSISEYISLHISKSDY